MVKKMDKCPCYIDRPLHRYDKGCLIQSQAFAEQQTEEKPILRCDEIKNCPIKENYKQLRLKEQELNVIKKYLGISNKTIMQRLEELQEFRDKDKEDVFKYKQALETIKNICDEIDGVYPLSQDILDIINEELSNE